MQLRKTARAFRACLDLLDTAEFLRNYLRGPLGSFGLSMGEFRLLLLLYEEGRMSVMKAVNMRSSCRQNLYVTILALERAGLLRRENATLPPVPMRKSRLRKSVRGRPRRGRQVRMLRLTPAGERVVRNVLPRQAKLVKARMRALDGREQETLSRLCAKLREGDVLKFYTEITHVDVEEED